MSEAVAVVTYHAISDEPDRYTISPGVFAKQIEMLANEYQVIPLREITRAIRENGSDRRVVLTFDDAFKDFRTEALPVLERLGLPATVFVPTGHVGAWNRWDSGRHDVTHRSLMAADELVSISRSGLVDLGSHTVGHCRMSVLDPAEMHRQAVESKRVLEQIVGRSISMFSYPYGQLGDFSSATTDVLAEAGYELAVTTHWGVRHTERDVLTLRRIWFTGADTRDTIRAKVNGWYDWIGVKERLAFWSRRVRGARLH